MQFRKIQTLRGPNIWANFPVLEAWVDLVALKDSSSDAMPGFNDRLMNWLPSLIEHRCSVGQRGGFFERLRRGTYLAHILEHVALELQTLAGTPVGFGRTRQANDDGVYKVALEFQDEQLGRAALEAGRRLCLAAVHDTPFDLEQELKALGEISKRSFPRPGIAAIIDSALDAKVPVLKLDGNGLIQLGHGARQRRLVDGRLNTATAAAAAVALDNERAWNLLYAAGLPVPEGRAVESADDAWQAAQELGSAVVIKPRCGKKRRGTGWNLVTRDQIELAYRAAAHDGNVVLVERQAEGATWRLLVVGDQVIDVACRSMDRSCDVADVHPDLLSQALDAAQTLDLDIAGIDIVAGTLTRPLEEQGGVIVAVTPCPNLDRHARTPESARKLGSTVLARLFPNNDCGRIPVVGVTGTNGKTTVTRLIAHILGKVFRKVGMTCTEGIYLGGKRLSAGDCSGPLSARAVLQQPRVDAAVLETARGGILRSGLGFDRCDVAVVTNVGEGDHLGAAEIDTPEQLAWVKSVLVAAVAPSGTAVLNAEDPLVVGMAKYCRGKIIYFAKSAEHPILVEHRNQGGRAVFLRDLNVVLSEGVREETLISVSRVPLTHEGRISFHVENTLAAAAAVWSLGVALDSVRLGLETFAADLEKDPGRFNLLRINGGAVILDYGHNADALLALIRSLDNFPHEKRSIVYSSSGDRRDEDLVRQGEILGHGFDHVILYEDPRYLRGRAEGGITGKLREGLARGNRVQMIEEVRSWEKAATLALDPLKEHELLVLQPDVIDETVEFVNRYLTAGMGREISMDEALEQPVPQPDKVVYPADHGGVEVRPCSLGQGAYAVRSFAVGEQVYHGWGKKTPYRIRESMQIDVDEHVFPPSPLVFFNHSCDPNCGILIRRGSRELIVHALRPVVAGEQLTLDYATFEAEVEHVSGPCQCGTALCRGQVMGYDSLPQEQREAYGIYVAEYLRETEPAAAKKSQAEEVLVAAQG